MDGWVSDPNGNIVSCVDGVLATLMDIGDLLCLDAFVVLWVRRVLAAPRHAGDLLFLDILVVCLF